MNLKEWCVKNNKEQYLRQWNKDLNVELTPENISYVELFLICYI